MAFFSSHENRVKCGKCGTEFDLSKNSIGCPLCGFGKNTALTNEMRSSTESKNSSNENHLMQDYMKIPLQLKLPKGQPRVEEPSKFILWGMVNSYFPGKFMLRLNANLLNEMNLEYLPLSTLIEHAQREIVKRNFMNLKGFPNDPGSDASINRQVYHFIDSFYKMGLFDVRLNRSVEKGNIWNEDWKNILIRPTQEGLEFAQLKNRIFDEFKLSKEDQILTKEEIIWMKKYLEVIDNKGFKEFSLLREIDRFIQKQKNPSAKNVREWFMVNLEFIRYVREWSSKNDDEKAFNKQLANLAQTFSSGKISLLRELGVIKNKRNDYTLIGAI